LFDSDVFELLVLYPAKLSLQDLEDAEPFQGRIVRVKRGIDGAYN
jgi:hypothetical protein